DVYALGIKNSLIVSNQAKNELLRFDDGTLSPLLDLTIANNQINGSYVMVCTGDLKLSRSIIDQPGLTTLQHGGSLTVAEVLSSAENASLGGYPGAFSADPRFVDPAHGDYHLQAASQGVDLAPADPAEPTDFSGAPRDVDIAGKLNFPGPRDI